MRSITRPLAAVATSALLALSLAACGDGGDDKAGDGNSPSESTSSSPTADASASDGVSSASSDAPSSTVSLSAAPGAEDLCAAVTGIIKTAGSVTGPKISEAQWKEIQKSYGALDGVALPGANAQQKQGRDVAVDAITSMSYQDALKAFAGESKGEIPGVSAADSAKAEAFFAWAGKQCPTAAGPAASATVPESSVSAN